MYFTYTLFTDISLIKSSRKNLQIFLKTPNNRHKMCEDTLSFSILYRSELS